jgi:hypothetical protein
MFAVTGRIMGASGSVLERRQDVPDRASRTRRSQSCIDCGYRVVVPFGLGSHADRIRADGRAAAFIGHGMIQGADSRSLAKQMKARAAAIGQLLARDDHQM